MKLKTVKKKTRSQIWNFLILMLKLKGRKRKILRIFRRDRKNLFHGPYPHRHPRTLGVQKIEKTLVRLHYFDFVKPHLSQVWDFEAYLDTWECNWHSVQFTLNICVHEYGAVGSRSVWYYHLRSPWACLFIGRRIMTEYLSTMLINILDPGSFSISPLQRGRLEWLKSSSLLWYLKAKKYKQLHGRN